MSLKVLFLTPQLPYPPISGGTIKSYRLIKHLSEHFNTSIFCLLKGNDRDNVDGFTRNMKLEKIYFSEINIDRNLVNLVLSYTKRIPLSVYRNFSKDFMEHVKKNAKDFDVIVVDHFLMFQYVPQEYKGRIILHQHNAEFLMWDRFSSTETNLIKRIVLKIEAARIKKYEEMIMGKSDKVLLAPNDIEVFKGTINPNKIVTTYHLSDDSLLNCSELLFDNTKKKILYVGTLTWDANIDGLKWFLLNVWPLVRNQDVELIVIGKLKGESDFSEWKYDPYIRWLGFVDDLIPFYNEARVFIAPLRFGSGIKVKVVSALYRGLPIVTTTVGAEGLPIEDGKDLFITNDASTFANSVIQLLNDKERWSQFAKNSRKLAIEELSWDIVLKKFQKAVCNDD